MGKFDLEELYRELGLRLTTIKRGKSADLFSTARALTDEERRTLQEWVDAFYAQFVDRVAEGLGVAAVLAQEPLRAEADVLVIGALGSGVHQAAKPMHVTFEHAEGMQACRAGDSDSAGVVRSHADVPVHRATALLTENPHSRRKPGSTFRRPRP